MNERGTVLHDTTTTRHDATQLLDTTRHDTMRADHELPSRRRAAKLCFELSVACLAGISNLWRTVRSCCALIALRAMFAAAASVHALHAAEARA